MQVEDDTGEILPRPGEETLGIAFDQPHRAIDDRDAARTQLLRRAGHEIHEPVARDVQLGDHLGGLYGRAELAVELLVVVIEVDAQLVGVGPVELAGG